MKKVRVIIPRSKIEKEEAARLIQRKLSKKQSKLIIRLGRAS